MRITLNSRLFDLDGSIDIDARIDSTDGATVRRVTRVATTDGGVAINDRGYSEGDRTLDYTWRTVSKDHNDSVDYLVKTYPELSVSTSHGVYLAAPEAFTPGVDESNISLLVKSKLSE